MQNCGIIYKPSYDIYIKYKNMRADQDMQRRTVECEKTGGTMTQYFNQGWICSNSVNNKLNKNIIY